MCQRDDLDRMVLIHRSWRIERWGTESAPWCLVHEATGFKVPVLRPYPGQEPLPPIEVCNFRSRAEAEAAAGEIDWNKADELAKDPEVQAAAKRYREKREFDDAYQRALVEARAGRGPWPWEPNGLLHRGKVVELPAQPSLFDDMEAAA